MIFKRKKTEKRLEVTKHVSILKKAETAAEAVLNKSSELKNIKSKEFSRRTLEFKKLLQEGKTTDDILVDAFALAHRAIQEVYGISLFKVQIMGAWALHKGDAAEMRTGEGKTLTAILPSYLNALSGSAVHVITVNEYLATRDAFNTGKVHKLLGLKTGVIKNEASAEEKKLEYAKDVVYTTNAELGFDYLRDNMVKNIEDKVQRSFDYAIVDEVDSILIDEARVPLIISGGSFEKEEDYVEADKFVKSLLEADFVVDQESKMTYLTDSGILKAEMFFKLRKLYSNENSVLVHRISNALQANHVFTFDVDYTVKDDEIVLIDIFTGRLLQGRQYSEGLNQAIEAKEGVKIKPETKTHGLITYQNLFRMYKKLSGMSGTALTEEEEFLQVYNMRVIPIPTNMPIIRNDHPDVILNSKEAKNMYIIRKIKEIHQKGQPILVGTRSVQDSEFLAEKLRKENLELEILNAKNHSREADIISKAGRKNAITISTNMAGRGTDIRLGKGVVELGGLFVIGTERHEARRIDNQLRGRSGRQGDPGESIFFVSLQDEIVVRSGFNRFKRFTKTLDNSPVESRLVTRSLTSAQKKMEGVNYDQRKSTIEYDDVINNQRIIVYKQRDKILTTKNHEKMIYEMMHRILEKHSSDENMFIEGNFVAKNFYDYIIELWDIPKNTIPFKELSQEHMIEFLWHKTFEYFKSKYKNLEEKIKFMTEKFLKDIMIYGLDMTWTNHLEAITKLKSSIHYRQYAQQNPIQIFVFESKDLFEKYKFDVLEKILNIVFTYSPDNQTSQELKSNSKKVLDLKVS